MFRTYHRDANCIFLKKKKKKNPNPVRKKKTIQPYTKPVHLLLVLKTHLLLQIRSSSSCLKNPSPSSNTEEPYPPHLMAADMNTPAPLRRPLRHPMLR
ncbi:hypothetical protein HanRHA438_Chr15g0716711 [Helianthus annuus]|nr:hypothetical protein HanRHA438_Chr15g0716711 [Helianthus annuus]